MLGAQSAWPPSNLPMEPPMHAVAPPAQVLPLNSPTTAQWVTVPLPFTTGWRPTSTIVDGRLHVITYDIDNVGSKYLQYLLVRRG